MVWDREFSLEVCDTWGGQVPKITEPSSLKNAVVPANVFTGPNHQKPATTTALHVGDGTSSRLWQGCCTLLHLA